MSNSDIKTIDILSKNSLVTKEGLALYLYNLIKLYKLDENGYYKGHNKFLEEYQSFICSTNKNIDFSTAID